MFFTFVPLLLATAFCAWFARRVPRERLITFWLLWSGFIHICMELSYGFFSEMVTHGSEVSFGQFMLQPAGMFSFLDPHWWSGLYAQYARYDGRYVTHDPVILLVTQAELVMGPGCFLLVWMIAKQNRWRHAVQPVLCTLQAYGTYVYFFEPVYRGTWNSVMTSNSFDLFTFVIALNGLWIAVPALMIWQSSRAIATMASTLTEKPT
jgi:hypothetical protein